MDIRWEELTNLDYHASYYDTRKKDNLMVLTGYTAGVSFFNGWKASVEFDRREPVLGEPVLAHTKYRKTFDTKEKAMEWVEAVIESKLEEDNVD